MESFEIKDIFCHKRLRRLDSSSPKRIITSGESMEQNMTKLLESITKALPGLQESTKSQQTEVVESIENITVH